MNNAEDMGRGDYLGKNLLEDVIREESGIIKEPNKKLITPNTKIKCSICGYFMSKSKNDDELYLCYRCNIRITQSDLEVQQIIVPKRESPGITRYGDEFVNDELSPDNRLIFRDKEDDARVFNLLNQTSRPIEAWNPYMNPQDIEAERTRQAIKDLFRKKSKNENIDITFSQKV